MIALLFAQTLPCSSGARTQSLSETGIQVSQADCQAVRAGADEEVEVEVQTDDQILEERHSSVKPPIGRNVVAQENRQP